MSIRFESLLVGPKATDTPSYTNQAKSMDTPNGSLNLLTRYGELHACQRLNTIVSLGIRGYVMPVMFMTKSDTRPFVAPRWTKSESIIKASHTDGRTGGPTDG